MVTVETPEQTRLELRIAPFGSRIVAALLDYLLLFGIILGLSLGALAVIFALDIDNASNQVESFIFYYLSALGLALFIIHTFFFVFMELKNEGQTFGKRLLRIRTVMASGHGLTLGGSLIRNLARIVDTTPLLWIVPALDPSRRRIGDILANTLVVEASNKPYEGAPIPRPAALGDSEQKKFYFSAEVRDKIFPDDIDLLEHFFQRLPKVNPLDQQEKLIEELARRYRDRLGMRPEETEGDPRRFLQELYFFVKDRLFVVTDFLAALMALQGGGGGDEEAEDEDEPELMQIISYRVGT